MDRGPCRGVDLPLPSLRARRPVHPPAQCHGHDPTGTRCQSAVRSGQRQQTTRLRSFSHPTGGASLSGSTRHPSSETTGPSKPHSGSRLCLPPRHRIGCRDPGHPLRTLARGIPARVALGPSTDRGYGRTAQCAPGNPPHAAPTDTTGSLDSGPTSVQRIGAPDRDNLRHFHRRPVA